MTWSNPHGPEGKDEGVRTIGHPHGVFGPAKAGKGLFKLPHVLAEDKGPFFNHLPYGGVYLFLDTLVLDLQVY